ncbi:hypothetical protein EIP86_009211 [Pleurotus ostreatoroseus]|nr:hypothetical protein EIP86_009211 [Pleurotus ostreatoroseus]
MAPKYDEEDWSDSDDELADVETAVQLGVPDGPLPPPDAADAAVSRIGGLPAFLTAPPPLASARCKNCSQPMELLVQVWCPLEGSPHDRALYVWGCARGVCQRLEGSVRAWRGLRYNERYAAKLKLKKERQQAREAAKAAAAKEAAERKAKAKANPFKFDAAQMGAASAPDPFGLGAQIFGAEQPDAAATDERDRDRDAASDAGDSEGDADDDDSEAEDDDDDDDDEALATALASTTLETSEWKDAPAYAALYLSTVAEYLPPAPKAKLPPAEDEHGDGDDKGGKAKDGWNMEGYEHSLDVDHVFERFAARVAHEGAQCIRYERGGAPLPFAHDALFDRLFPAPPRPNLPVTRADSLVVPPAKRAYNPSSASAPVPACAHCGGRRVFECQLMPNLINVLQRRSSDSDEKENGKKEKEKEKEGNEKRQTDAERRAEVERVLKGGAGVEAGAMEWGTCFVFSCENDCAGGGEAEKSCWREEVVLVQWDT